MKTTLPSLHNRFAKEAIIVKLLVFIATLLFCFCNNLHAGIHPNKNRYFNGRNKKAGPNLLKVKPASGLVVPTISYGSPQVYTAGTTITALAPASSGVAAVTYDNTLVNISTGLIGPRGLAVDAAGNVYVADYLGGVVKKIPVGGGAPVTLGSGFSHPMGVAVDPAGNVYVADLSSTDIKMIPVGGGAPVIIATGFSNPFGIAIDVSGNLYVADYSNKAVKMIPATGGAPVIIASGFNNVACVAVDAAGNVYAGDSGDHAVYEIPAGGGAKIVIGSGPALPYGLTLDGAGNIYIADGASNLVKKIPAGGGAPVMIGSGSDTMTGVAIDASGNLYVSEFGNKTVNKISVHGGYHINAALPAGLAFDEATGIISGTPTISSPATDYIVAAFNSSGSSQATVNIKVNAVNFSYSSQTYITATAIAPLAPISSGVAAVGYSNTTVNVGAVFNKPRSLAMDAMGNIYVADYGSNSVKKIPAGGGAPVILAAGINGPVGVALDAAGNVYVAEYIGNTIKKIPAGGGAVVTVGSGFIHPNGVAVDGAGNIFVADNGNHAMKEIPVAGGAVINLGTYTNLLGVTTDAAGNVYFAEKSNGVIYKLPATGGLPFIIASGFTNPLGLTVDAAGNLFIADGSITTILELPALSNTLVPISSGFNIPADVIADAAGNLYVADYLNNAVKKIKPTGGYYINALPAGLNFDNATGTISGTPAVVSPATDYFVTAYNNFGSNAAPVNIKVNLLPLPILNYIYPSQPYTVNNAITPMPPQSSGVAAPGYSGSPSAFRSGLNNPIAVAADNTGRVFFAETGLNLIRSAAPGNNNTFTSGSGYNYPAGVAVDGANMYVADQLNNVIKKNDKNGGSSVIIGSGFNNPCAVAVDALGNVYVADKGNNAIKKIPVGGGAIVTLGSGFNQPSGVAVDAAGNVYVADYGNNAIKMIPVGGGSPVILGSGFNQPNGVAVDASGYIYIADTGNNTIEKMPAGGGTPVVISTAIVHPLGIAVNDRGILYVVDNLNSRIIEIKPVGGYYVNRPLPAGLIIDNTTGIVSGTPLVQSPYQYYYVIAYNNSGDSGFHVVPIQVDLLPPPSIGYNTPKSFTKNIAITPLAPVSTNVSAVGYNSSPATIGSGFSLPVGVAVDGSGNVYVADKGNGLLKKIAKAGGAVTTIGSGFNDPSGVTVDGAGNVYVADNVKNKVYKVPVDGSATVAVGTGFSSPAGIAIDSTGNIYVADNGSNAIKKIPFDGSATITLGSGFSNPTGVAVDVSGNVYVADAGNNAIKIIPAGGGAPVIIGSGFNQPLGVAVDAGGNVYVGDFNNSAVKMIPAGGGAIVALGSGFNHPYGVAVDALGNVYTSDYLNNAVKKIIPVGGYFIGPALPQGLKFDNNTGIISGTPTVVSPAIDYTVTGYNISANSSTKLNITVNLLPPPTVSYSGPQIYKTGKAITPLAPVSSGVTAPGFNNSPVMLGAFGVANGIAIDAAGNIYITDHTDNTIKKVPANGGMPVIIGSGFTNPNGLAVDAAGNVYVGDLNSSVVKMIPAGGGAQVAVGSGFSNPYGVAADAAGNIFVNDYSGSFAYKIPANGGAQVKIVTGLIGSPTGIAVDGAGNIYIASFSLGVIKKIPADGSPSVTLGSGFNQLYGVAADNFGNVFVGDYGSTTVKEIPAGGGAPVVIASGFTHPTGIAVDAGGNVYVSDLGNNQISKIKRNGGYYINPALPAGLNFDNATGVISGTPTVASPLTNYTITAYNTSGGSSATVNIKTIVATSNATLSSLSPSKGALSPVFAGGTISYTAIVPNATAAITITPTAVDANATIKVNGTIVNSGATSASLPLAVGSNAITTVVTSSDGTTTQTYTLTVTRAVAGLSTNALLTSIKITPATALATVSGPGYKNYTTTVPNSETSLTVTSVVTDATATIKVNGTAVASGAASAAIPLAVGSNVINIVATAQDGATTKTYIITATRALSSNATLAHLALSSGTLSPAFAAATITYTASVAYAVSTITVTPTAADATATIKVNGTTVTSGTASASLPLNVGANVITTVVTAQDATTKTYMLTVNRASNLSNNALLTSIKIAPATALATVSGPGYKNYTTAVPNSETSLTVTSVTTDANATIKVNGTTVASGAASGAIPLIVGGNVINIVVTAQDGTTTKTYIITATRAPSSNATLAHLTFSSGTLSPVFAAGTISYTASVAYAVSAITVTPTTADATATIKINGTAVTSGTASASLPLNVGANVITTVVTAQDATTKTYTLTVTRASNLSNNALLTSLKLSPVSAFVTVSGPGYKNYTTAVPNGEASLQVIAVTADANATLKVNGTTVASGVASQVIPLSVGDNVITVIVTAQDGTTTKSFITTATRAAPSMALQYTENAADSLKTADDGIAVHQGISPNGDGINDVLIINNIEKYPDNKLTIMNAAGAEVYQATGYDNAGKVFDGHSNKTRAMQRPGTYFYQLEYRDKGKSKYKTGYILIKY